MAEAATTTTTTTTAAAATRRKGPLRHHRPGFPGKHVTMLRHSCHAIFRRPASLSILFSSFRHGKPGQKSTSPFCLGAQGSRTAGHFSGFANKKPKLLATGCVFLSEPPKWWLSYWFPFNNHKKEGSLKQITPKPVFPERCELEHQAAAAPVNRTKLWSLP